MYRFLLLIPLLLSFLTLSALSPLDIKGHLDKERLEKANKALEEVPVEGQIVITLSSSSGELQPVLEFSRNLFQSKRLKGAKVYVYIDQEAIGPAAIIPFLADERYGSYYLSWGDIPLGNESQLPANILRKQVTAFISPNLSDAEKLRLAAAAMSDPGVVLSDDGGLKQGDKGAILSKEGETLVLNQNEVQQFGLVKALESRDAFLAQYSFKEEIQKAEESPLAVAPTSLEEQLAEHIKFNPDGPNTIGHIKIDDRTQGISQATWIYVKSALDAYKESKPAFIILELDTPGGQVFPAQTISDALKEIDTQYDIPVVTFINNWAISAGAMLAYSTRFITAVKDGSMGAAEPVIQGQSGMESASEKINSALRADFANRARFFDRNADIAEAMVDKDIILVFRNGKVVRLDTEDQIRRTGMNPDKVISGKGKLLTLNSLEMIEYGVGDLVLQPAKVSPITNEEKAKGEWPAEKMLLFQQPFFKAIPKATVVSHRMDWKTQLFSLLTTPVVSSALFLGMMLGLYMEFNTPGFGIPGTVGVTCLILIIISSMALEIGNMLELILVIVGLGMLAAEIFLIPSFGLMGVLGILFFFAGVIGLLIPNIGNIDYEFDTGTFNAAGEAMLYRLAWLGGTIVLGVILMAVLGRYVLPSFAGFNRFILKGGEQDASEGYFAGDTVEHLPKVGARGVALTTLRPAGKVDIGGQYFDALTTGDYIDKGAAITVTNVEGNVIYVSAEVKA